MISSDRENIAAVLKNRDNFLVTAHINPDGDALGSMAALGYILERLGKKFVLYNESGVPEKFLWLNLPTSVHTRPPRQRFDWIVVLDSGDAARAGDRISSFLDREKTLNIDHHLGNPGFGRHNWVEPGRSSVGEMIALLGRDLGIRADGPLAEAVYLALVSDTGFFTYDNTTPEVLELTAELLRNGLDAPAVNQRIQNGWSVEKLRLHGRILERAEMHCAGRVGVVNINRQDFAATGTSLEDCEGLVNYLRYVSGVQIAMSIREEDEARIKFSLRSSGTVDVQKIAVALGGGGHKNASGGTLEMDIHRAKDRLLEMIRRNLPEEG
ncbi:MAG: DHH family phosphoesterase [Desulfonatronovibrionaceae bacterium]